MGRTRSDELTIGGNDGRHRESAQGYDIRVVHVARPATLRNLCRKVTNVQLVTHV